MQINPFLSSCTNLKSKWIKDLHIKPDTLNRTPMAYALRTRIDKWDLIKLQSFYKVKDTVNRTKLQPTNWKKIFTNPTSDRELISNLYKELKTLVYRESNNPIKNGVQS